MPTHSEVVRSFPFPVLEEGNLSFPNGEYAPEIKSDEKNDCSVTINHRVTNAPFVEQWVGDGKALCCCTVSIPVTGYRRLFTSAKNDFEQTVQWETEWVGEPPVLRPIIVCKEQTSHIFNGNDGVHDLWVGREITFSKGARIAVGPAQRPVSSLQSLLSIEKDETLDPGCLSIVACPDQGFYFCVKVASNLFGFLQSPGGGDRNNHSRSILIHAVSSCFALLGKDYQNENGENEDGGGWGEYSNLRALAADMESKNLRLWNEDDFQPEKAATALYPHLIPKSEEA